jgi:hypothetical protein
MNQIQTQSPIPQSWRWLAITSLLITCLGLIVPHPTQAASEDARADKLMVVDCLLPGKVRKIGGMMTYLTPRRPVKTTTTDCEIRGGEHTSFDRANYATALKIWLPEAKQGDPQAQTYVGEIFEKGLGTEADYQAAATWYLKAAEQGYSPAQINLGQLYEQGLGVKHDMRAALNWYRRASGLEDDDLEWASSVRVTLEQQQQQIQQLQQLSSTSEEQLAAIRKQLQTAQSELGVRQKELKVARNKRDEISRQLARQDSIIDSSTTDGRQQKQLELDQEQARLDARRTELARLAEDMKQQASLLTEKQRKSAQQNTLLENQFLIKQAETERLRKRMQGLNLELEQTRSELSEIDTRDRNLIARLQTAESERKSLQDSLLTSEQQVESLQTELTSARGNLDQTVEQKSVLETQFLTKQAETERIRKRLQAVNLELDQSHSELSGSDSRDRAQMARLQAVESERASLQTSLMSSDQQVQSLQSELTSARSNLDESASKYAQTINELDQRKILYEVDTQRLQADRDRLRSQAEVDVAEIRKLRAELKSQEQNYSVQIDSLSARYDESQARVVQVEQELDSMPAPAPIEVAMAPPSIELFEPPVTLTRGAYAASVAEEMDKREVIGRVLAPAGLVRFNVNEQPVEIDQDGLFTHWVPLTGGRTPVNMAVVDRGGQRVAFDFDLLRRLENEGDFTARLAMLEEIKTLPAGAVWDYYCLTSDVPFGGAWLDDVRRYEAEVLSKRG